MKLWPIVLIFLFGCSSPEQKPNPDTQPDSVKVTDKSVDCPYTMTPAEWERLYCRMKTNANSDHLKPMKDCMGKFRKVYGKNDCEKKAHIKEKACELQISLGYYKNGPHTCLKDKSIETHWEKNYF